VTDDATELKAQLQAVTGERIAALAGNGTASTLTVGWGSGAARAGARPALRDRSRAVSACAGHAAERKRKAGIGRALAQGAIRPIETPLDAPYRLFKRRRGADNGQSHQITGGSQERLDEHGS